jgi:hypothetical protein
MSGNLCHVGVLVTIKNGRPQRSKVLIAEMAFHCRYEVEAAGGQRLVQGELGLKEVALRERAAEASCAVPWDVIAEGAGGRGVYCPTRPPRPRSAGRVGARSGRVRRGS